MTVFTTIAQAINGRVKVADLPEAVQDIVGTMLISGGNLTLAYDDTTGKVTLTATGGSGTDTELVRDTIGAALVGTQGVTVAINDATDTITLGISGLTAAQITNTSTLVMMTQVERDKLAALGPTLGDRGAWQTLTLASVLTADPAYPTPAVRLDRQDMVRFRGVVSANAAVTGSTTTSNDTGTVIFTLPAGTRPGNRVALACSTIGGGTKVLFIQPSGNVTVGFGNLASGNILSLDGLTFPL